MKNIRQKILFLGMVCTPLTLPAQEKNGEAIDVLPQYPVPQGVSAPFAGFVGEWLIVAGGCNFPDVPVAEGGTKVYYSKGYALRITDSHPQWQPIPDLPQPTAYGSAVQTPEGLVCIGGMNADSCLTAVWRIEPQDGAGNFIIRPLPSLPETVDNAAATWAEGCVYLTGGNTPSGGRTLYALRPGQDSEWKKLTAYPEPQRVQPVLTASNGSLFLAGGFQSLPDEKKCLLSTDILRYDIGNGQWEPYGELPTNSEGEPRCLVGGTGVGIGNHLLMTGGVNYSIFKVAMEGKFGADYLKHEPEWYKFNSDLLIYDCPKEQWSIVRNVPGMARAGGILLYRDNHLYMICGETKPGIRTSRVTAYSLDSLTFE